MVNALANVSIVIKYNLNLEKGEVTLGKEVGTIFEELINK